MKCDDNITDKVVPLKSVERHNVGGKLIGQFHLVYVLTYARLFSRTSLRFTKVLRRYDDNDADRKKAQETINGKIL